MFDVTPILRTYAKKRVRKLNRSDSLTAQKETLLQLCRRSHKTQFAKKHELHEVRTIEDFQRRVPIRTYDEMRAEVWGDEFPNIDGVSYPGQIKEFALTSGTSTGYRKYVPCPRPLMSSHMRAITDMFCFYLASAESSHLMAGQNLVLLGSTDLTEIGHGRIAADLTGLGDLHAPILFKPWRFRPRSIELALGWEHRIEKLAQAALSGDVRSIAGYPSWLLFFFARLGEAAGKKGAGIAELLPRLELIVHGGVNFSPYKPIFDCLLEGSNAQLRETYAASEAFIGLQDTDHCEGLRLLANHGVFYEFVPLDQAGKRWPTERRWLGDIQPSVDYELVLTNCGGLWSYAIGDVIRFTSTDPPRLVVSGRVHSDLSPFGEHILESELSEAVAFAANSIGIGVADFTVHTEMPESPGDAGRHCYLVEFRPVLKDRTLLSKFNDLLDMKLKKINDNYRLYREMDNILIKPKIISLNTGAFEQWMRQSGKIGGQNKVPRIMGGSQCDFKELYEKSF